MPTKEHLITKARELEKEASAYYTLMEKAENEAGRIAFLRLGDKSLDLAGAYRHAASWLH